jgi:hypothetical protein
MTLSFGARIPLPARDCEAYLGFMEPQSNQGQQALRQALKGDGFDIGEGLVSWDDTPEMRSARDRTSGIWRDGVYASWLSYTDSAGRLREEERVALEVKQQGREMTLLTGRDVDFQA